MSSILILSKNSTTPATPATDKIGIYVDSSEILAYINDLGATKNLPPWTQATSWTPAISFGGGTTGITYTTQFGRYERIGGRVFLQCYILLSNKGSSTGVALVTGLPVGATNTSNYFQPAVIRLDTMSSISGHVQGFISPNGTTIRLEHLGTGTAAQLTEANFNNTSSIMIFANYEG